MCEKINLSLNHTINKYSVLCTKYSEKKNKQTNWVIYYNN